MLVRSMHEGVCRAATTGRAHPIGPVTARPLPMVAKNAALNSLLAFAERFPWLPPALLAIPIGASVGAGGQPSWPLATVLTAMLLAGLGGAAGAWLASRPVRALRRATQPLASGDVHVVVPFRTRTDGIGALAQDIEALRLAARLPVRA